MNDSATQDQIVSRSHPDLDTDWVPEFGEAGPFRPLGGCTPKSAPICIDCGAELDWDSLEMRCGMCERERRCPICHRQHDGDDCGGAYLRDLRPPKPRPPKPPPPPDGWRTLAADIFAVSRDGEASRLKAGTWVYPVGHFQNVPRGAVEVQVWTDQVAPFDQNPPVSHWYVDAVAVGAR